MGPEVRGNPREGWAADVPASAHLFVGSAAELTDVLGVAGEDGHHLARVLRLRVGETVSVAEGSGTWRLYRVASVGPAGAALEALGVSFWEPAPQPRLAVAFALTKGDKPDLVVQKLTELGIDRILPVVAERSVARPRSERAVVSVERWRRIAREAARQCRRATLPIIEAVAPLDSLAGHPGLVVAERGGAPVTALEWPQGGELLVVIGPEGGLADEEVKRLAPWARVDLGPHILRAETAALAAAAMLGVARTASQGRG